nr:reverse transcriptase domain-containing protein [Tanacetum cinerariifolium]
MIDVAIKQLIAQGVATALAEYEAKKSNRNSNDSHDSRSGRRIERATRECTYSDFMKCQPFNFKGIEGVVGLTKWFKKMEYVFHISNCTVKGTDVVSCTQCFQELALMCGRMFHEEYDEVKYVGGLLDMIQGSVMASKPKTTQEAIEIANDLMD